MSKAKSLRKIAVDKDFQNQITDLSRQFDAKAMEFAREAAEIEMKYYHGFENVSAEQKQRDHIECLFKYKGANAFLRIGAGLEAIALAKGMPHESLQRNLQVFSEYLNWSYKNQFAKAEEIKRSYLRESSYRVDELRWQQEAEDISMCKEMDIVRDILRSIDAMVALQRW